MPRLVCALIITLVATSARADAPLCTWARVAVAALDAGEPIAEPPAGLCRRAEPGSKSYRCSLAEGEPSPRATTAMKDARTALERCFDGRFEVRERRGHSALGEAKGLAIESKTRGVYLQARGGPETFFVEVYVK